MFEWNTRVVSLPEEPLKTRKEAFIKIFHAGGTDTTFRPATDADKAKYPEQWAAFERGQAQDEIGWPIEKAPFLDEAQAQGYRALGVKTLEALAEAHDVTVQRIMGGREHREKARTLLKETMDKKPMLEALSQIEQQGRELEALRAQLAQMQQAPAAAPVLVASPDVVPVDTAVRRGRPPKSEPGKQSDLSRSLPPAVLPESDE